MFVPRRLPNRQGGHELGRQWLSGMWAKPSNEGSPTCLSPRSSLRRRGPPAPAGPASPVPVRPVRPVRPRPPPSAPAWGDLGAAPGPSRHLEPARRYHACPALSGIPAVLMCWSRVLHLAPSSAPESGGKLGVTWAGTLEAKGVLLPS